MKFVQGDLLAPIQNENSVDVVVSNPPYLDDALMNTLADDIRNHEPADALYGGPDGLDLIRRLLADTPRILKSGGLLAIEIAGNTQVDAALEAVRTTGCFAEPGVTNDYASQPRVITAICK